MMIISKVRGLAARTTTGWPRLWLALVAAVMAGPAAAQDLSPISGMINTVVKALTGPIGGGLAILGVLFIAFMLLLGNVRWGAVVSVFVGIVLIFSAPAIVAGFS